MKAWMGFSTNATPGILRKRSLTNEFPSVTLGSRRTRVKANEPSRLPVILLVPRYTNVTKKVADTKWTKQARATKT